VELPPALLAHTQFGDCEYALMKLKRSSIVERVFIADRYLLIAIMKHSILRNLIINA
jgi:hypothetical protein